VLGDLDLAGGQAGIADRHHWHLSVKLAHDLRERHLVKPVAEPGEAGMHRVQKASRSAGVISGGTEPSDTMCSCRTLSSTRRVSMRLIWMG
jgi:hypothetical protein